MLEWCSQMNFSIFISDRLSIGMFPLYIFYILYNLKKTQYKSNYLTLILYLLLCCCCCCCRAVVESHPAVFKTYSWLCNQDSFLAALKVHIGLQRLNPGQPYARKTLYSMYYHSNPSPLLFYSDIKLIWRDWTIFILYMWQHSLSLSLLSHPQLFWSHLEWTGPTGWENKAWLLWAGRMTEFQELLFICPPAELADQFSPLGFQWSKQVALLSHL